MNNTIEKNGSVYLNPEKLDGCPFCGSADIQLNEDKGKTGTTETVSISSTCYGCHTVKYIALPLVKDYYGGKPDDMPEQREKYAATAIENWNERPKAGVQRGTKKIDS